MKLFASPASPYVRKVLVLAIETGQEVETLPSAASPVSRDPAIVALNPSGKIPTAILPDGSVLYDSRVITQWLDSRHDGPRMYPEPPARWTVLRREALADGLLDAALLARYETIRRPEHLRWPDWVTGQMDKIVSSLDALNGEAPGFGGIDAGLIAIGCAVGFVELRFPDLGWRDGRADLARWYDSFSQRESMRLTVPR